MVETCIDIQYITGEVGKDIDMSDKKQLFKDTLDMVIDGVSLSTHEKRRGHVGAYVLELLLKDNPELADEDDVKTVQSIIGMADDQESPAFKL